jgi:MrcB-like, N-terminal domain/AAA domain (dynein-related subfamily)/EVE domain
MIPDISIEDITAALEIFDKDLRDTPEWDDWERKGNYKYAIDQNNKLYPPKFIIHLATGVPLYTFSGGSEANDFLHKKGFKVVRLNSEEESKIIQTDTIQSKFGTILTRYNTYQRGEPIGKQHEIWNLFEKLVEGFAQSGILERHPTIRIEWSAGRGRLATIPWIAFFDYRETKTTQEGVYCVFLFREDMSGVYWTLNQGVTQPKRLYGDQEGREFLKANAVRIRSELESLELSQFCLDSAIDLHTSAGLGSDYELSTIGYKLYEANSVPQDKQIIDEVDTLLTFYSGYVDSKHKVAHENNSIWIFQANPKIFDLSGALNELTELTWLVQQSKRDIRAGGQVFLWESGKNAGIVASARILEDPKEMEQNEGEKRFNIEDRKFDGIRLRVSLKLETIFLNRIKREELLAHPILSKLGIITFPNATNFAVTQEQFLALIDLIGERDGMPPKGKIVPTLINPVYTLRQLSEESLIDEAVLERWVKAIERKGQGILYGPPGTGKTFIARKLAEHIIAEGDGFAEIVQFHPAYSYEDFIQGIRPRTRKEGGLDYPVVPGRFLQFCEEALTREQACVLIIDEINRANLSRVFGELMYLLEYRDHRVPLAGGGSFKIPANVRLIGTMNTADRSIALVDHALRRRFAFIQLNPNYDILRRYHKEDGSLIENLIEIIQRLNKEIGDHRYEIGISYFLHKDLKSQIEDIWRMEIEPYLEEYFFDQPEKVDLFRWGKLQQRLMST